MLKLINQNLIDKILEVVTKGVKEETLPLTFAFGFDAEDYDGEWRECTTAITRQVIAPLLEKYEISNITFYDDRSFEFTIEERRETFI